MKDDGVRCYLDVYYHDPIRLPAYLYKLIVEENYNYAADGVGPHISKALNRALNLLELQAIEKLGLTKFIDLFLNAKTVTKLPKIMYLVDAKFANSNYYSFFPHRREPGREDFIRSIYGTKKATNILEMLLSYTPMKTLQLASNWKARNLQIEIGQKKVLIKGVFSTEAYTFVKSEDEKGGTMVEYGCFFENEPIMTLNGVKKIKDITPTDYVYSNGNFLPVRATQKRFHQGLMVGFYLISTTDQLVSTPNHPFYTYRDGKFEWVRAENLTFNDKLAIPIPKNLYSYKDITIIGEVLEYQVYGKSIGAGVISYRKEPKYLKNWKKDGEYYIVEDLELWKRVHNYKYELPTEYLLLSKKNKKFIVSYYMDTIIKTNNKGISFAFLSSTLAYQFQLILASLNIDSKIFGKFKSKKYAIVSIRKEVVDFLTGKSTEYSYKNIEFSKGFMLVPIQTVFNFNYKGNVYNIEIDSDDDNNKVFVVKNVLVHNSYLNKGIRAPDGLPINTGGEHFLMKTATLLKDALVYNLLYSKENYINSSLFLPNSQIVMKAVI